MNYNLFNIFLLYFYKRLVEESKYIETQDMIQAFEKIERTFNSLGIGKEEKSMIYAFLASILHLGNTEFTSVESQAKILESLRMHLHSAAKLLKIDTDDLEKSLLFHSIEVNGDEIT